LILAVGLKYEQTFFSAGKKVLPSVLPGGLVKKENTPQG
jgi:hypothetical protein